MTSTPSVVNGKSCGMEHSFSEEKYSARWRRGLHVLEGNQEEDDEKEVEEEEKEEKGRGERRRRRSKGKKKMEARLQFWNGNPRGMHPSFFERKRWRAAAPRPSFFEGNPRGPNPWFWIEMIDSPAAVAFIFCWKLVALHWFLN